MSVDCSAGTVTYLRKGHQYTLERIWYLARFQIATVAVVSKGHYVACCVLFR